MASEPPQRVYANTMAMYGGAFDVAMDFGARVGDEEPTYDVRVSMSWQHFKLMVAICQQQIAAYEAQAGPIPMLATITDAGEPE
jgi:hypothetical protein